MLSFLELKSSYLSNFSVIDHEPDLELATYVYITVNICMYVLNLL